MKKSVYKGIITRAKTSDYNLRIIREMNYGERNFTLILPHIYFIKPVLKNNEK